MRSGTPTSITEDTMATGHHGDNVVPHNAMTRHLGDVVIIEF
jgi:hypothetical protein